VLKPRPLVKSRGFVCQVLQTRVDDLPVDAAVRSHVKDIVLGLVAD